MSTQNNIFSRNSAFLSFKIYSGQPSIYLFLFFFALGITAQSQIPLLNKTNSLPRLKSRFEKHTNSYFWQNSLLLQSRFSPGWNWHLADNLTSTLLTPANNQKLWKDEHRLNADFFYALANTKIGIYTNSWLQNDEQLSAKNQFANHSMGLFLSQDFQDKVELTPSIGYQQLNTRKKFDYGWDVGLKMNIRNFEVDNYRFAVLAESQYDFYDEIQNYENNIDLRLATHFSPYTSDSLILQYAELSKENYDADFTGTNRARIYQRQAENKLFYMPSNAHQFRLSTLLRSKNLSYFSNRNVFFIRNELRYLYFHPDFSFGFYLRTNEEIQDNEETLTDSDTKETAMGVNFNYILSHNQSLDLDFSYIKQQYDTPEKNNDDRDAQRFVIRALYHHKISSFLTMEWLAYTYLFHQIYIHAQRSHNNNWNRIIKLSPRVHYRVKRFTTTLSTQILANYTAYDFEQEDLSTKSFVFRRYSLADSLNYRFWASNSIGFWGRVEFEDRGTFYQDSFAQQIIQSNDSYYYNIYLQNRQLLSFLLRVGYSVYNRQQWRHIPQKYLERRVKNRGPYIHLAYLKGAGALFSSQIAYQTLDDSINKESKYFTGYIRLNYYF